jgi:hypothetical protein
MKLYNISASESARADTRDSFLLVLVSNVVGDFSRPRGSCNEVALYPWDRLHIADVEVPVGR